MAHPKRKHSHSRTRKRRTHQKLALPTLVVCEECRNLKVAHRVCPYCGYYRGREYNRVIEKKKEK